MFLGIVLSLVSKATCTSPPRKEFVTTLANAGLGRIISGLFKTIFAFIDSFVNKIFSIDPTKIPLYVTGDFFGKPLALLNSAKRYQFFEDNLTPHSQKEKNVNIKIPPNKEKPTIETRKLLRIISKCLWVALDHQVSHA